jgi:iron-sulfur cluster assembly protein
MQTSAGTPVLKEVIVTDAAQAFMRRIVRFGGRGETAGFRLSVRPGGCSGFSSEFTVEAAPQGGDEVVPLGAGLKLFLPAESRALLAGVTVDFRDTKADSGFAFIDPNAENCACSTGASKVVQLGSFSS